jgi:hypothetical protein
LEYLHIYVAQDSGEWRALVNTITGLRIPQNSIIFLPPAAFLKRTLLCGDIYLHIFVTRATTVPHISLLDYVEVAFGAALHFEWRIALIKTKHGIAPAAPQCVRTII